MFHKSFGFPRFHTNKIIQRFLSFELVVPLDPTFYGKQGDVWSNPRSSRGVGVAADLSLAFPGLLLANHGAVEDVL